MSSRRRLSPRSNSLFNDFPLLILLTFLASFSRCAGQVLPFKLYTTREGLLSNGVTTLFQDSYGYLWIGTTDGRSIYNGESFRNYTVVNGIASSWVNCIIEDGEVKGEIWIATLGGGVSRFFHGTFTNFAVGSNAWTNRVNSICQGEDGTVYCATEQGVFELAGGKFSLLSPKLAARAFVQIGCRGDSLFLLDDKGNLSIYNLLNGSVAGLTAQRIRRIGVSAFLLGSRNELWLALMNGTIENYYRDKVMPHATGEPANFLLEGRDDVLWVGTTDGLYDLDERTFGKLPPIHITTGNGLPDDEVWSGLVDREGELWLGVGSAGLCRLPDEDRFDFEQSIPSIAIDNSQAAADKRGHIWSIDSSGVLEIWRSSSGMVMGRLHRFDEFGISHPEYLLRLADGSALWLCSESGLIRKYRIIGKSRGPSKVSLEARYRLSRPFLPGSFLTFYIDRQKRFWCSLNKLGVLETDTKRVVGKRVVHLIQEGLPDNSVRAMFEDKHGNMWFGGYIGGLSEFRHPFENDSSITLYTTRDGLPDNSIRAITDDSAGDLWIGTRFGGIAIMRDGKFKNISAKDGLLSNGVWAITRDADGGMLLGTQLGLQSIRRTGDEGWQFRGLGDRVPVYSVGISNLDLRWTCTPSGTTVIDLKQREIQKPAPWVHITKFFVNGEAQALKLDPAFSYNENTVTFDFNGVSLMEGKELSYRYILFGVDRKWRYSPGPHAVTYVSLRPGNYRFEVRAVEPSGLESANAAAISFSIVPPYWQQWWFIALVIVALVSLIYFSVRYRLGRVLEIERVRSRIASDLHDEIGSGLTRIAILADSASQAADSMTRAPNAPFDVEQSAYRSIDMARKIGSNARGLIDSMSDVIWSIDPKYDSLADFLFYFRIYANEIAEAKGIVLDMAAEGIEKVRIGPQTKRNLQLISKEALSNAVKYSGCRRIQYRLSVANKRISISLEDDGCGFDLKSVERGLGLDNMERHAREMHGELAIHSSPGGGTRIICSFPIS